MSQVKKHLLGDPLTFVSQIEPPNDRFLEWNSIILTTTNIGSMFFIGLFGWDLTEFNLACKSENLYYLHFFYDDFHKYDGWAIGTSFWLDSF